MFVVDVVFVIICIICMLYFVLFCECVCVVIFFPTLFGPPFLFFLRSLNVYVG